MSLQNLEKWSIENEVTLISYGSRKNDLDYMLFKSKDIKFPADDISKVSLGNHMRYFITSIDKKTGNVTRKFRLGGVLANKDNADKYIILSNGTFSWSVQVNTAIFFKKMTIDEIKEEYEDIIHDKNLEIKQLKKEIKLLKKQLEN